MREELPRAARSVRPDQDRAAVTMHVRQLPERSVEHDDVVGGGVATCVPAPQPGGEELAGVVAERHHGVIPEGLLERRRRLLLLAVADHDRRVQVDHQPGQRDTGSLSRRKRLTGQLGALRPDNLPCRRPRTCHPAQRSDVETFEQPPARRVRGHRPEQRGLIRQHRDVGDCGGAIGHRDRHVHQHPSRIMTGPRPAHPGQRLTQLRGQRGPVRDISQQSRPRMRHHTLAVGGSGDARTRRCSLHLESASPSG
jgi:hypothetical protein